MKSEAANGVVRKYLADIGRSGGRAGKGKKKNVDAAVAVERARTASAARWGKRKPLQDVIDDLQAEASKDDTYISRKGGILDKLSGGRNQP